MTQRTPSTTAVKAPHQPRLTARAYVVGYMLSLACTGLAYSVTRNHLNTQGVMTATVGSLALAQLMVQLLFFLHLGRETKPRWKAAALYFTVLIVGIIVLGSLWIMNSLNYRMTSQQVNTYLQEQDGGI